MEKHCSQRGLPEREDNIIVGKASKSIRNFKQSNGQLHCTNNSSAVADMDDRLATIDMGRKLGGCTPYRGAAGSPSNTMWPGQRPTSIPSGILIHPAVWSQ